MNQFKREVGRPKSGADKIVNKKQKAFVVKLKGGYIKKYSESVALNELDLTPDRNLAQTFTMNVAMDISKRDYFAKVETVA